MHFFGLQLSPLLPQSLAAFSDSSSNLCWVWSNFFILLLTRSSHTCSSHAQSWRDLIPSTPEVWTAWQSDPDQVLVFCFLCRCSFSALSLALMLSPVLFALLRLQWAWRSFPSSSLQDTRLSGCALLRSQSWVVVSAAAELLHAVTLCYMQFDPKQMTLWVQPKRVGSEVILEKYNSSQSKWLFFRLGPYVIPNEH